jgi:molecular chaperone GrpE
MSGKPDIDDANPEPTAADQPDAGVQTAEAASPGAPAPEERIAELEGQIADLTDRLLRAHAEMDNVRKRAEREKIDTAKYAISKFATDIVTVGDNFARAASAVPPGAADNDPALKALLDGVTMMEREFLNVLDRHGVKRMDPTGQPFNPHLHEAVMEQQNADVPSGTVVQVFQAGYTLEDRVLRPAMVVVAKGGPKPQDKAQPEAAPEASE